MKIIGTGVDIVENSRIKKSIANNFFYSKKISMNCNARLIWGGDKTINQRTEG